jgi:hypothetical protein
VTERVEVLYKHSWYTAHSGMAIKCDKCGAYAHKEYDYDFEEVEKRENCPIKDDE